jgi:hypothetical protein
MSTTRQRAANAANAQHSTGPKSQDTKAAVRFNATKHGLTSKLVVIPGEGPEAFDSLKADLTTSYQPANLAEQFLVEQIAENPPAARAYRSSQLCNRFRTGLLHGLIA